MGSHVRRIVSGIALYVSFCACTSAMRPTEVADAVVPYSHELQDAEPFRPPFVAHFEKGDENLFFVAAVHGCDPKTFHLIDDVLVSHRIRMVVFEGRPNSEGVNSPAYARHFEEWGAAGFCQGGGEGAYAATHAAARGASFVAGEPDEPTVVQAVLKQGFTVEDLLGFYFVRQVPQFEREGTLASKGLEACFRLLIDGMVKKAGLPPASAQFSLEQFRDWYLKRQGKPFDLATVDREETAPLASGKYFTQRVSAVTGIVRDRFIVQVVANRLATDKDVLVVYGGSHFATQRPAFERLMGKPVEVKPAS